jgi:hypothetical protein
MLSYLGGRGPERTVRAHVRRWSCEWERSWLIDLICCSAFTALRRSHGIKHRYHVAYALPTPPERRVCRQAVMLIIVNAATYRHKVHGY